MFNIDEQVVHRIHGAGKVVGIEEKIIDGQPMTFIRVRLTLKEGDILIPNEKAKVDLRKALDESSIQKLTDILSGKKIIVEAKGDEKVNPLELIASNDPFQIAQAIRILTMQSKSPEFEAEKKLILSEARMKLAGELMNIRDVTKQAALSLINRSIHGTDKFLKAAKKRRKKIAKGKS